MAATMRIAEVADRSGFSAATLRYYEQLDLLPAPQRTASGYRAYDESVLVRLAFIARAKTLGCSLEEIAELMPDWDGGRCAPVQARLQELVTAKLGDARARAGELAAFTVDLQRILAGLGAHTPEGPCDSDCGCLTDSSAVEMPTPVVTASNPVACTLDAAELPGRLQEWRDFVAHVVDRTAIDGGTRLQLDADTPLDELALLVAAEQGCCSFFAFAITVDNPGSGAGGAGAGAGPGDGRLAACGLGVSRGEGFTSVGVGAVACAACCAAPVLALLTATGIATVAGFMIFGTAAIVVGALVPGSAHGGGSI